MLRGLIRYFTGVIRVRISGACPERALNEMANRGFGFYAPRPVEGGILLWIPAGREQQVQMLCREQLLLCETVKRRGAGETLRRTRRQQGLLCGLALVTALLLLSNTVILRFDVSGCGTVSPARVLQALRMEGVNIGTPTRDVSIRWLSPRTILRLPQVSWLSVNRKGSTAYIGVDERIEAPSVRDEELIMDVRSSLTGMVYSIDTYAGTPRVRAGDTVLAGDVLISARMESPFVGEWYVNPGGSVILDTWYTVKATLPARCATKAYTGRTKTAFSVILGAKRINLSINTGNLYTMYDKIEQSVVLPSFVAKALPFSIQKTMYTEYTLSDGLWEGTAQVESAMSRLLEQTVSTTGQVLSCSFARSSQQGAVTVTMQAHCRQEAAAN